MKPWLRPEYDAPGRSEFARWNAWMNAQMGGYDWRMSRDGERADSLLFRIMDTHCGIPRNDSEAQAQNAVMRAALNKLAAWDEGETVKGSFDNPQAARTARDALTEAGRIFFNRPTTVDPKPCGTGQMPSHKAKEGWWCTRADGHDGPCAALLVLATQDIEQKAVAAGANELEPDPVKAEFFASNNG